MKYFSGIPYPIYGAVKGSCLTIEEMLTIVRVMRTKGESSISRQNCWQYNTFTFCSKDYLLLLIVYKALD